MKTKRITVLGSNGMLGRAVVAHLAINGMRVRALTRQSCNVCDTQALERVFRNTDAVINCAAWTDVDGAESQAANVFAVNAEAPKIMARIAAATGTRFIHVSTDYVFDGSGTRPWTEAQEQVPQTVYGRSKYAGEVFVLHENPDAVVARIQWTYALRGEDCITRMMHWLSSFPEVHMVDDQIGAPTPVEFVADALCKLLDPKTSGIYHVAPRGYASRYDVAVQLKRLLGVNTKLTPCQSSHYTTPAVRPLNTRLDCSRFDRFSGEHRPHWCHLLHKHVDDLLNQHEIAR